MHGNLDKSSNCARIGQGQIVLPKVQDRPHLTTGNIRLLHKNNGGLQFTQIYCEISFSLRGGDRPPYRVALGYDRKA